MLNSVNAGLFKSTVAFRTVATNQAFLNIDEGFSFFFLQVAPPVPFILGRLGIPIFGNKEIPIWQWHYPNEFFFSSEAKNDLPPYGRWLRGTEPGQPIERRSLAVPTLSCSPYLEFSIPRIPSQ